MTEKAVSKQPVAQTIPWRRILIGLSVSAAIVWYFSRLVNPAELTTVFQSIDRTRLLLSVLTILSTLVCKALRWQLLFVSADGRPTFRQAWSAYMLGVGLNIITPIPRLGEVARIYHINQSAQMETGRVIGTLAIEKALETVFLLLSGLFILPLITDSLNLSTSLPVLALTSLSFLLILTLLAWQHSWVLQLIKQLTARLPARIGRLLDRFITAGLSGLYALRSPKLVIQLLALSSASALLTIATPYLLFQAFDFPLSFAQATIIHIALSIGVLLPGGPIGLGTFEGVVFFLLGTFGIADESARIGYGLIYHSIVVGPPLLLAGGIALTSSWRLRQLWKPQ